MSWSSMASQFAKMEISWLAIAMAATALLIGCEGHAGGDIKVIHIGGKVLCQDCSKGWNEWVHGATPLKGCKVAVTCVDGRKRVVHHGVDETDEQGSFDLIVNKYINGKPLKPEGCTVRLVSSPHRNCDALTNFAGGKSGVNLRRPSVVYRDLIEYMMGPFYFTSPICDDPDTSAGH